MKKLTIRADSWHYRLAKYGRLNADWDGRTDLCRYFWALLRGVLFAPALVAIGVFFGSFLTAPVVALVVVVLHGPFELEGLWAAFAIVGSAIWFVGAAGAVSVGVRVWMESRTPASRLPGLIKTAYRGWREKTCVLVEIEK